MAWTQEMGALRGGTDVWFTPDWAVEVIADYIPERSRILCPFDSKESAFYRVLSERGHEVEASTLSEGVDFFERSLDGYDYVISNPPFSQKDQILTRLYDEDKKFALICNWNGLFDSRKRIDLAARGAELIVLYPRVQYVSESGAEKNVPYQSCYWCRGILRPGTIRFEKRVI